MEGAMNIGASVVIKGNITASEDLTIAGRVEGEICLDAGALLLAPGSWVVGDVTVPSVVVHGSVDGSITATERVDLRPGSSVSGSLSTARLLVADGAQLNCRVDMPKPTARPQLVQPASPPLPVAV
jgi:cytoskeletal protein CcmA (bactofilin family)